MMRRQIIVAAFVAYIAVSDLFGSLSAWIESIWNKDKKTR